MFQRLSKFVTASGMAAALAVGSIPKPAAADTQSTINTLIGAAAVVGGLILYNNYQHKRQAANTVVGYTANGGTVYGDGRIVLPSGQTIYPNSNGQYPWGQTAYYNQNASGYTYDTQRTGRYDRTHRHGSGSAYYGNTYNRNAYSGSAYNHNAYNHNTYNGNAYNHAYNGNGNAYGRNGNANGMRGNSGQVRPNDAKHGDHHDHDRGDGHDHGH